MKKRKLKKEFVILLYVVMFVALTGLFYSIEKTFNPDVIENNQNDYSYVSKTMFDNTYPVISSPAEIGRPYYDETVNIVTYFYDVNDTEEHQKNALILTDSTYLQSSGVSYSNGKDFDVIAILDGTVIDVKEDSLLGNIVEIRHNNDLISIYQSVTDIAVKVNDIVTKGQVICKSGKSNIESQHGNHLHFELISKGLVVNPENFYGKKLADL